MLCIQTKRLFPENFKIQIEEIYASEMDNSYAEETKTEQEKVDWCDLIVWQFPSGVLLHRRF